MTDEDILKYFENKKSVFWNKLPDNIINYLKNRYQDNNSNHIKESYLRILNNIDIIPKCPICGKPLQFIGHSKMGFYKQTCGNSKCANKLAKIHRDEYNLKYYGVKETWQREDCKQNCRKTWREKYGVDNPYNIKEVQEKCAKNAISEKANIKRKQTNLLKYGHENVGASKHTILKIKEIWKNKTIEELLDIQNRRKKTCKDKYNVEFYQSTNEFKEKISKKISSKECLNKRKQTNLERYGIENYNNQEKRNNTLKLHNNYCKSKYEDECYELLKSKYPDIKRQYRSKLYTFNCDFYIPSLDLYIEYQGSQFHNKHPFDKNNENDLIELENLRIKDNNSIRTKNGKKSQYSNIIYVWTDLDVRKRNLAKQNNLNFIEFWNIEELKEWLNKQ